MSLPLLPIFPGVPAGVSTGSVSPVPIAAANGQISPFLAQFLQLVQQQTGDLPQGIGNATGNPQGLQPGDLASLISPELLQSLAHPIPTESAPAAEPLSNDAPDLQELLAELLNALVTPKDEEEEASPDSIEALANQVMQAAAQQNAAAPAGSPAQGTPQPTAQGQAISAPSPNPQVKSPAQGTQSVQTPNADQPRPQHAGVPQQSQGDGVPQQASAPKPPQTRESLPQQSTSPQPIQQTPSGHSVAATSQRQEPTSQAVNSQSAQESVTAPSAEASESDQPAQPRSPQQTQTASTQSQVAEAPAEPVRTDEKQQTEQEGIRVSKQSSTQTTANSVTPAPETSPKSSSDNSPQEETAERGQPAAPVPQGTPQMGELLPPHVVPPQAPVSPITSTESVGTEELLEEVTATEKTLQPSQPSPVQPNSTGNPFAAVAETSHSNSSALPNDDLAPIASRDTDRLAGLIKKAQENQNRLKIQLNPEEFGQLEIEVTNHQGKVHARLSAGNASAQQALLENLAHLHESLAQHGLRVDQVDVNVPQGLPQSSDHAGNAFRHSRWNGPGGNGYFARQQNQQQGKQSPQPPQGPAHSRQSLSHALDIQV